MLTSIQRFHRFFLMSLLALGLLSLILVIRYPSSARLVFSLGNPTPLSPLYYVKVTRENLQSLFIFGSIDRSGWELTLAQKRIEEAKILNSNQLNWLANRQFNLAKDHVGKARVLINSLHGKTDTNFLDSSLLNTQKMLQGVSEIPR